jgi:hypothetical protein
LLRRAEGAPLEGVPGETDMFIDLVGSLGGASVTALSPAAKNIGHSLIWARAGASVGRKILSKMPTMKLREVLGDAMLDPGFMKVLLTKPTSVQARQSRDKKLMFYMLSNDLVSEKDAYDVEEADYTFYTKDAVDKMLAGEAPSPWKGKKWTPIEIMDYFEVAARQPNTGIGPYNLNSIQGYLDLSHGERAKIQKKYEDRNKPYTLKAAGRPLRRQYNFGR